MEENKKREDLEEIETLDLGISSNNDENKELNESLEGTSVENVHETILNDDLNAAIKHENFENKIMSEDNPVDNVFGEEFVSLDNVDTTSEKETKPKKKKNGLVLIIVIILLLAIVGGYICYSKFGFNDDKLEETMRTAALDYYDKYTSANTGASAYTITLNDLKNANENYDLDSLKNCNDENTLVIITIDYATGKAKNTEVRLDCKIF